MKNILLILVTLTFIPVTIFAMPSDVASGMWYTDAALEYFEDDERFRPNEHALRKEVIQLIIDVQGGASDAVDENAFDDVPLSHPLHTYFVQAATKRWLTGQGNCYGISDPCFAVPDQPINRAEMAALLIRAFALQAESNAPKFDDVPPDAWYALYIQNASSMCILQGDDNANTVRPADTINRAEMVVMLKRAGAALQYPDCEASEFSGGSRWPVREEEGVRSIEGFQDPYGLDMIDGMLYVSDGGRGQVLRFTEDLQYRGWLGMLDGNPNGWHDTGDPTRSPVAGALDFPQCDST